MPLKKDQPLPDITLKAKTEAGLVDVNLRRNVGKGPTVLLFFPLAFTGVCTDEMCKVTNELEAYKGLGADVIAISVDSPFAQEAWAKQNAIGLTVASDMSLAAIKAFKVVDSKVIADKLGFAKLKVAKRAVFVADKSGKIVHVEAKRDPGQLPNFGKVRKAVGI
jgi:glutaredoxin-dependent peroxiredoxin